jgi:hypothetical protein
MAAAVAALGDVLGADVAQVGRPWPRLPPLGREGLAGSGLAAAPCTSASSRIASMHHQPCWVGVGAAGRQAAAGRGGGGLLRRVPALTAGPACRPSRWAPWLISLLSCRPGRAGGRSGQRRRTSAPQSQLGQPQRGGRRWGLRRRPPSPSKGSPHPLAWQAARWPGGCTHRCHTAALCQEGSTALPLADPHPACCLPPSPSHRRRCCSCCWSGCATR